MYHRTDSAEAILREGFRDSEGSYLLVGATLRGVWLSDVPVDVNEGAKGDALLEVVAPGELDLDRFEIVGDPDSAGYREWCMPAALINESCTVRLLTEDEEHEAWRAGRLKYPRT